MGAVRKSIPAWLGVVVETWQTWNLSSGDQRGSCLAMSGADRASGPWGIDDSVLCSIISSLTGSMVVMGVYDVAS